MSVFVFVFCSLRLCTIQGNILIVDWLVHHRWPNVDYHWWELYAIRKIHFSINSKFPFYIFKGGGVKYTDFTTIVLIILWYCYWNSSQSKWKITEDASWLRKKDELSHINVAESVLKGVNLALKWGLRNLEVKTNSDTVCGWIETIIKKEKKVRKNQQRK